MSELACTISNHYAPILEILILLLIAIVGGKQLKSIERQNELIRIVQWKNSLNEINKMMIDDPKKYIPLFYPESDEGEAVEITGAYTSLNTMEIVYHMRKDEEDPRILDELLRNYIKPSNKAILNLWGKDEAYRHAFTKEFREKVDEILKPESCRSD